MVFVMPGFLLPHFTIEYRKHFTQFHSTVVETGGGINIGQTECFAIYITIMLAISTLSNTSEFMGNEIDYLEK